LVVSQAIVRMWVLVAVALVAAGLTTVTSVPAARAAAGDLDPTFTPYADLSKGFVYATIALRDGKYLIGGGGDISPNGFVARLNPDGSVDSSLTSPTFGGGAVSSLVELRNGQYLVGGTFTNVDAKSDTGYVVRLNADGTLDTSFTPPALTVPSNGFGGVGSLVELSNGLILIGGDFEKVGGVNNLNSLARLDADGTLDSLFTPPTLNGPVGSVAALSTGQYLIGGRFTNVGGDPATDYLARLNPDGARDATFAPLSLAQQGSAPVELATAVELSSGEYLIGGQFRDAGGNSNVNSVARVNPDGSLDPSFTPPRLTPLLGTNFAALAAVGETRDGQYLIGGAFTDAGGDPAADYLVRLNSDGSRDTTFSNVALDPPNDIVVGVLVLSDGNYLVYGLLTSTDPNGWEGSVYLIRVEGVNPALTPNFASPTPTTDGFTAQVTNYDSAYNWEVSAGAAASTPDAAAQIDDSGLVTVMGIPPGASAAVTVITKRPGAATGSATITGTALPPPPPVLETELVIKDSLGKKKKLKPGKKVRLVKTKATTTEVDSVNSAAAERWIKKVRTQCLLDGTKLKGKAKRSSCTIDTKRSAKKAVVKATPHCSVGLKIRTKIVAKAPGATRDVWKRTWKVRNSPRSSCAIHANG